MNANSMLVAGALLLASCSSASAGSQLFEFTQTLNPPTSNVLSATVRAQFSELDGSNDFTLRLTYLAATVGNKFDHPSVLTGFTWDIATGATITAVSAVIASGSQLINTSGINPAQPANVNGFWAFNSSLSGGLGTHGVGTSGGGGLGSQPGPHLADGSFGKNDLIDKNAPGAQVDGVDYGLVPKLPPGKTFNVNKNPVVQNSLVITLHVQSGSFDPLTDISNAHFLFSSGLEAFSAGPGTVVPEPSSLALLTIGLVGVAGTAVRRRRSPSENQDDES